jgi:hypothetical protein
VKDEYPLLLSISNIREGSLVVWCTVSCRLKVFCAIVYLLEEGTQSLVSGVPSQSFRGKDL